MSTREVTIDGGSPWGFRMHGGADVQQPLRISRVNPGSKAAAKGIREGDVISSINGQSTKDKSNADAHLLLKNSGDILRLGLNEEGCGSPKKRQYKTVQQETHSETVKRTNATTHVITTTRKQTLVDTTKQPNGKKENPIEKGGLKVNCGSEHFQGQDCFSEKSTISSNYSSAASTPSTLTDTQGGVHIQLSRENEELMKGNEDVTKKRKYVTKESEGTIKKTEDLAKKSENGKKTSETEEMPDTASSKSRKRRRSNGSKKKTLKTAKESSESKQEHPQNQPCEEVKSLETYRVESPKTVCMEKKKKGSVVKSKSLDDEEAVRIQEISSETTQIETDANCGKSQINVIIEADSDDSMEIAQNLSKAETIHTMNIESLKLESIPNQQKLISTEDESNLRCFLESLNLPTTPDETHVQEEKVSSEVIRAKRAKKREELAQYFLPVYQNPRYLDVISEENSDHSDREGKDHSKIEVKKPRMQRYIPRIPLFEQNPGHQKVETVLVETENIETPIISDTCTISVMEESSGGVEVVFLDDNDDESEYEDEDQMDMIPPSQLTPPPTPDSRSPQPTKENEIFNFNIEEEMLPSKPIQRSCALSPSLPSRSPSYDREDSSSRGTSLCTTICSNLQPKTLRELCLDALISLPFGQDVLEELANVSKSLQELTNNITSTQNYDTNISDFGIPEETGTMKSEEKWVGIATDDDPQVVVCLSPTQKDYLDSTKTIPREADKLLDLHNKFVERSYYSDTEILEKNTNGDSRLLALIHEIKPKKEPLRENYSATLPLKSKNLQNPRLQAENLGEWLQLARSNRTTSEYNLNLADQEGNPKRRRSLPNELYVQQMQYIIQKEKEIQQELEKLEEEKRRLQNEMTSPKSPTTILDSFDTTVKFDPSKYHISKNEDIAIHTEELKRPILRPTQPSTENFRKQMYNEYMQQIAERQERKHQKVIKISSHQDLQPTGASKEKLDHAQAIEDEFMTKLREKKYCQRKSEERDSANDEKSEEDSEPSVLVITDGKSLSDTKKLPKHLKEFVDITRQAAEHLNDPEEDAGIWTPGQRESFSSDDLQRQPSLEQDKSDEPVAAVWTPKSAGSSPQLERKEFRPVNFSSPVLSRKNKPNVVIQPSGQQVGPPWRSSSGDVGITLSSSLQKRIPTSHSAPPSGFSELSQAPRLPRAQNPTITLLQKAREGQLPKGALYIEEPPLPPRKRESPPKIGPGEIVYEIKNEYTSESENERPKRIADLSQRKFIGIGPTTTDGMPLTLRSEVRDQNQSKWYKRMYDTIHKQKPRYDDDYVTIRYKHRRGRYPYTSGYVSEPEPGAYDSDIGYYHPGSATLDRRRTQDNAGDTVIATYTMPRTIENSRHSLQSDVIRHGKDVYKNQPGRIENYIPGHSSISEKEAKEWWDEVMDIFDGHLEQQKHIPSKGYMSQALKESGYESDSTLVFRRKDDTINQLSPSKQKEAYRSIQKGGDVPLHGLRKPAPERPKESPRKYVENEVTIHYKTPVRQEVKEAVSEDELQRRQAEHMKKVYQEERRRKYLQVSHSVDALDELQDMNSRRHTDNFIPSQKSPIPLNRYDDFIDDYSPKLKPRPRSPEPRLVAKALYNFVGQTARELTFRKGDIIYIRRQVDKNWYEGEHNAMVGLFPANYVEIVPYDGMKTTTRKSHEGQARAKYNFIAQTHLELSLAKGELVVVTRKVDDNWFEGRIGGRKGIFPVSYVEMLIDPTEPPAVPQQSKPVASPAAHSLLLNGSLGGKESMGSHNYVPHVQTNTNGQSNSQNASSYHAKPIQLTGAGTYGSLNRRMNPLNQELHVDTQSEPYVPYRALYKYKPQNEDEIELNEGDTVYVLEKCDDGWFVGASDRTGALGTFPGNYVERI